MTTTTEEEPLMDDMESLSDAELDEYRRDIELERNRRSKVREIPQVVKDYAREFKGLGGASSELIAAVESAYNVEEETDAA